MGRISSWDWEVGRKTVVDSLSPLQEHEWQEEPYVSPDGETVAAIVKVGDGEFSVRANNEVWETPFEKLWFLRYSPDGRLTALCQQDMEWSLAVDGEPWGDFAEYVWETKFTPDGSSIAAMTKNDNRYCVSLNGTPWETYFENANQYSLSPCGTRTAAVVQVVSLAQADIDGFMKGVYSVAVDGNAWSGRYVNLFTPTFSPDGARVAAQARITTFDYTIAVDDKPWQKTFQQVWEPVFHPKNKSVAAPVRAGGKWGVAQDGDILWAPRYSQCLGLQYSATGEKLWAMVATGFGRFTIACNNVPWDVTFPIITDMVISPDGNRAAILANEYNKNFRIVINGKTWDGAYDMAWPVVFSADSANAAAVVEKGGKFHILVNGKAYEKSFDRAWPPVFSPDGSKVLIRAIENNSYVRIVADVARFQGVDAMIEIYTFVSGPLAWFAWAVFLFGSIYRLVSMYNLAKAKDGSSLAYMSLRYGLRSIFRWLIPFSTMGWKSDPLMTVTTFVFHIGFLLVAVFLGAHVVVWDTAFGVSWWSLPDQYGDIVSFVVIAACAVFAVRRLMLPHVKSVTRGKDWFALLLVVLPFVTGVLAYHQVGPSLLMTTLHVLFGELLIALIPFTRLSHALFVVFTRAYMGSEFGGVRHVQDWQRSIQPQQYEDNTMSQIADRIIQDPGLAGGVAKLTTERIEEVVNQVLKSETGAKLKAYQETCMRCGLCAQACHYYVSHDNDPSYSPVGKTTATIYELINKKGRVEPSRIYEMAQIAFTECNLCKRCAHYCPVGIDIAYAMLMMRRICYLLDVVPQYIRDTSNSHASTMNQMWVKDDEWIDSLQWQEDEARDEFSNLRIPLDKEGSDVYYSVIGPEPKFRTQLIYQAAAIMHVAGIDFTMPSTPGWDNSDMSMYVGDFENMGRLKRSHFESAQKLRVKKIVMGECGHAFRSIYDMGNRWLGYADMPVPVIHSIEFFWELLTEGKIKIPKKFQDPVTIHDPCNIIRGRGLMDKLRELTHMLCENVVEMTPNREHNYCCCAGGGVINCGPPYKNVRTTGNRVKAEQLARTGVHTVVCPCHNCHGGLDDIISYYELGIHPKFLGDIIYEIMEKPEGM